MCYHLRIIGIERDYMDTTKLKMKIGEHEFEAEGPAAEVRAQLDAWRELIAALPKASAATVASTNGTDTKTATLALDKIMRVEDRIVSLTARGDSLDDEILMVLFGQKAIRGN